MNRLMRDGISDPELWQSIREGNRSALESLYKRHYPALFRYGIKLNSNKEQVQDCLQDLFFNIWLKKDSLKEVTSVRFYLMKWLKREIIRMLTGKNSSQKIVPIESDGEELGIEVELSDFLEKKDFDTQRAILIKRALAELTKKEREVVYLRFFMGLGYEEISQIMNVNYQVVMNYMHRAMKALRENEIINNLAGVLLICISFISRIAFWNF
jgi:RNA polymerase sigma factor (sigma-70 family)